MCYVRSATFELLGLNMNLAGLVPFVVCIQGCGCIVLTFVVCPQGCGCVLLTFVVCRQGCGCGWGKVTWAWHSVSSKNSDGGEGNTTTEENSSSANSIWHDREATERFWNEPTGH